MRLAAAAAIGLLAFARAAPATAVVYGTDDRVDVYAETDAGLRALATASTMALIEPRNLRFAVDGSITIQAPSLGNWDDYCAGTPFVEQPTAAVCAGVLVDDDLVLTAAHCLSRVPSCRDYAYTFGYAEQAEGELVVLRRPQVFGCRGVAISVESPPDATTHVDFAVVALDRAVGPGLAPVAVAAPGARAAGEMVTTIGFPSGLPVKIDPSSVIDPRPAALDYFTLASDTFQGSSGSGIIDGSGRLAGLFARGTTDFVDRGGCRAPRVVTTPDPASAESATYAAPAIAALCAAGWPSARLCGKQPACGDGICSPAAGEMAATCPADCAPASCGDGLCESSEWDACPADCGDRRPADLPDGWFCEPVWYADGHTCDCDCGALDPDCGPPQAAQKCDSIGPGGRPPPAPHDGGCSAAGGRGGGSGARSVLAGLIVLALARRRRRTPLPNPLPASRGEGIRRR